MARGSTSKSKTEFQDELASMGALYKGVSEREFTSFGIQAAKGDAAKVIDMLGDAICNPALNSAELELLKEEVSLEHESNHTRYEETTMENAHFNSFREHMIGQPIKGDRDMTQELGVDQVREYHTANYYGDNMTVVATGDVSHQAVCDAVS